MANWLRSTCFGWVVWALLVSPAGAAWQAAWRWTADGESTASEDQVEAAANGLSSPPDELAEWHFDEPAPNYSMPFMSEGALTPFSHPDWLAFPGTRWAAAFAGDVADDAMIDSVAGCRLAAAGLSSVTAVVEVVGGLAPQDSREPILAMASGKSSHEVKSLFILPPAQLDGGLPPILLVGGNAELVWPDGEQSAAWSWSSLAWPRILVWATLPVAVGLPLLVVLLVAWRRRDQRQRQMPIRGSGRAMGRSTPVGGGRLSSAAKAR